MKVLARKGHFSIFLFLLLSVLIFLMPILLNPDHLLSRNNDLEQFFWPLYNYSKEQITISGTIPLWNYQILSGYPLIADPQSPLFYIPNSIFLLIPIGSGFILTIFLHLFFGCLGIYFFAKKCLYFSTSASLFSSLLYLTSPRLSAFIEAGHLGQVFAYSWIPIVLISIYKLSQQSDKKWLCLYSISLAAIFFTHSITFLLVLLSSFTYFLLTQYFCKTFSLKNIFYYIFSIIVFIGLVSITLIPQIIWSQNSTRTLLFTNPDVYPKWNSLKELMVNTTNPLLLNFSNRNFIDTEKYLPIGFIVFLLSLISLFFLKKSLSISIGLIFTIIFLISSNNLLPNYQWFLNQQWFDFIRVTTRFWIVNSFITIFLSAFVLNKISRNRKTNLFVITIATLALIESLLLSYSRIYKPIINSSFIPREIYKIFNNDKDHFRIFCTTKCFSQKDISLYDLETIEGYNTLIQLNYYKHSWELTKSYYNYYSLSVPPLGISEFSKIQPNAKSLGEYNLKYIVSPYPLTDTNFTLFKKIESYYVYKNNAFKNRSYPIVENASRPKITSYTPNDIKIEFIDHFSSDFILADVYSDGWFAYLNGLEKTPVLESPNALRKISVKDDTRFVNLKFEPPGFVIGLTITIISLLLVGILLAL